VVGGDYSGQRQGDGFQMAGRVVLPEAAVKEADPDVRLYLIVPPRGSDVFFPRGTFEEPVDQFRDAAFRTRGGVTKDLVGIEPDPLRRVIEKAQRDQHVTEIDALAFDHR